MKWSDGPAQLRSEPWTAYGRTSRRRSMSSCPNLAGVGSRSIQLPFSGILRANPSERVIRQTVRQNPLSLCSGTQCSLESDPTQRRRHSS